MLTNSAQKFVTFCTLPTYYIETSVVKYIKGDTIVWEKQEEIPPVDRILVEGEPQSDRAFQVIWQAANGRTSRHDSRSP